MIVYKIKDNRIVGISTKDDNYQLKENEYSMSVWYRKPFFTGTTIVETWTQADQDEEDERIEKQTVSDLLNKFEEDGKKFYIKVRDLIKLHHSRGNITDEQFKNIRIVLEPALRPLVLGDWDIAQDNINAITRPSGVLSELYDFVKDKIDVYLLQGTPLLMSKTSLKSTNLNIVQSEEITKSPSTMLGRLYNSIKSKLKI